MTDLDASTPDLRLELRRLDLLMHREILRLRAAYQLSLDELRGLYISDEQVDSLVDGSAPAGDDGTIARLTSEAEALRGELPVGSTLGRLAREFALAPFERDVLLLALAPELDLKYETLYAYLNDSVVRRCPTVDLALRLFAPEGRRGQASRTLLAKTSRLYREALIEPIESSGPVERRSELGAAFVLTPAVAAFLQGLPVHDARLADVVAAEEPGQRDGLLGAGAVRSVDRLSSALRGRGGTSLVVLDAEPGLGAAAAAKRLLAGLGRGVLQVNGGALPFERPPVAAVALLARLRGDGVFLDGESWAGESARRALPALLQHLDRAGVPAVLSVTPQSSWRQLVGGRPALHLALDEPDASERRALWTQALAEAGVAVAAPLVTEVAECFRLGPTQIARAVHAVVVDAAVTEGDDDKGGGGEGDEGVRARLFRTAREQSVGDLGQLAPPVPQRHRWSDLVLPPVVVRRLRDVSSAIRARVRVFGEWGFGGRGGSGLMVLFSGASGTGKTMSASVIAREIGLALHRIDLSSVVSKYIGETEKNLHRVFEAARRANVILFFDEADALLGKRSEVKDAHDRYANIEIAYLLQKMEDHDGVVILATNMSRNMDQAFARRMHFVVEFPKPEVALRERLWRQIFPPQVPLDDDVDFCFLARQFELTGGDVKTIALDAAFAAAGSGRKVTMVGLLRALSRQMLKQGKPLGASELKRYHGLIDGDPLRES